MVASGLGLLVHACSFRFSYLFNQFIVMSEEKKDSTPWWVSLIILGLCVYGVGLALRAW